MNRTARGLSAGVLLLVLGRAAAAQQASPIARTLTIDQAVNEALANHPRIQASRADEIAATARVDEARAGQLPGLGVSAQVNRSTGNTVPGAFFSTPGFAPIAGPVRGKTLDGGVWQSGASLWASWDVLSIARQAAAIDVALAGQSEAAAATNAKRLEVAYRAADAFLLLLEAQEAVRAARASVDRAQVLTTVVKPLVDQTLRPGVDLARAEAELAAAQTLLARAEQAREVRRAELAQAIGTAGASLDVAPGALLGPVDQISAPTAANPASHPDVVAGNAAVARAAEQRRAVEVQYLPRLDVVAAVWMRGSGYYDSPGQGLVPDVPNWAAGAVLTWNVLDLSAIRARARVAEAGRAAAAARRDEAYLAVAGELSSANAILVGATRVARQTPAALTAARAAEQQASARYKTGLISVVDVAEAQRLLAQAEIDDAVARLEVRRALLLLARAAGDLSPFLARATGGG